MLQINQTVHHALAAGDPIVALESTIITHGLPYPDNLEMAKMVEATVRDNGAIPATIAILHGQVCVGLDTKELETLATCETAQKASGRDLGQMIAMHQTAGTTVAATMAIAARANIRIFATGGIGGVHFGDALDVSADLHALSRYPVCVIASGIKSILNIPKTLEYLETLSVPVLTYNNQCFPAFYSRDTPWPALHAIHSLQEAAQLLHAHWTFHQSPSGVLLANPIPKEDEIPYQEIEPVIHSALERAAHHGIQGKAVTPFLLDTLHKMTEGRTIQANKKLICANAKLAAEIAAHLSR